ncbi:hypothetical protein Tco_1239561, partial [Tanacetum coccineum]
VLTPIPETPSVGLATTLLPPPTVSSISHVQLQTTLIPSLPINTETPSVTIIPDPLHAVIQSVSVLEKYVQELKEADNTTTLRTSLRYGKPIKEPVFKMASDDIEQTVDDMDNDADQPLDDSTQTKDKDPKKYSFKQPPRPPTPDQEWNMRQVVVDQPE